MEKGLTKTELVLMGSGELSFLGDSVYEVNIRKELLLRGVRSSASLVEASQKYTSAVSQSEILTLIYDELKENENNIVNRGRNYKSKHVPKNVSRAKYSSATALECLFGYLSLCDDQGRIDELIAMIFDKVNVL